MLSASTALGTVVPWTSSTSEYCKAPATSRKPFPALFHHLSSIQSTSSIRSPHHIYCLLNLHPILFSAFLCLAFDHCMPLLSPFPDTTQTQHSSSEAAAFGPHAEFIHPSKSQWCRCWCPSHAHPLLQLHSPPPKCTPGQQQLHQ